MAWIGIAILALAALALVLTHDSGAVGPFSSGEFADLARYSALALVIGSGLLIGLRRQWRTAFLGAIAWSALAFALVVAYSYRMELERVGARVYAELVPGATISLVDESGGQVVRVKRETGGHFAVEARVNGHATAMLVDTGASAVTLTPGDAREAGFDLDALEYTQPVQTANGTGYVARVTIEELAVGGIAVRDVTGLVTRGDLLGRSLLGMTFLERLEGYAFSGDTLSLRAHP